ncbi:MAG: potassium transporter [Spirochaetaceae bacterium]|jgi:trk system potassium uptake protein TrkH|nr:potassium transporter [Spirochaetaceae bacterium]
MKAFFSGKSLLFSYFVLLISLGSALLVLPVSWNGKEPIHYLDALFTSASAVCITGLITVDTSLFSLFGQTVIMLLIQAGGLGIITFSTFLLLIPGNKISLKNRMLIKGFYVDSIEHDPVKIIKNILLMTFSLEIIGTFILYTQFKDLENGFFISLFHSISAFCNAGFSTFSNNLEDWSANRTVLIIIPFLIVTGGLSFVVIHDLLDRLSGKTIKISLHSRIVLIMTGLLIISGTLVLYLLEHDKSLKVFSPDLVLLNSLFHSISPRTAGFNTLPINEFSHGSKSFIIMLMFIGGAPGSIAGGVKVTTFFLLLLIIFKGVDDKGEIRIGGRKLSAKSLTHVNIFILKALFILGISILLLTLTESESLNKEKINLIDIIFEAVSAFGTVGLSLGLTPLLSQLGKIVIILTMFAGRIGLVFLAATAGKRHIERLIDYPNEEVLIG